MWEDPSQPIRRRLRLEHLELIGIDGRYRRVLDVDAAGDRAHSLLIVARRHDNHGVGVRVNRDMCVGINRS
jgi:hypothetical protein